MNQHPLPIFNSALGMTKSASSMFSVQSSSYINMFFIMKGQKTILSNIQNSIETEEFALPPDRVGIPKQLCKMIDDLLTSSLGDLNTQCQITVNELHTILTLDSIQASIEKAATKVMNATLSIIRNLTSLQCKVNTLSDRKKPEPVSDDAIPIDIDQEDTVICRICEREIRISQLDEHTKLCLEAYQSETTIACINNNLYSELQMFAKKRLSENWPGPQASSVSSLLPLLHIYLLGLRGLQIDHKNEDSTNDLDQLLQEFNSFNSIPFPNDVKNSVFRIKSHLLEKRRTCYAALHANEFLKRTISGDQINFTPASIGDFDLIKRISAGAYARVFLARKRATGDIYAIKVLSHQEVTQKNQVKRVLTEKDILLQFNNPYIINFCSNNLYIVMEYLPGGDLYSLLQKTGGIDENSARIYVFQIVKALDYLHSKNIIHRDLKPDNILITAQGTLKLTDFGLSYLGMVDRQISSVKDTESLVQSSSCVGTPDYIAPEVILNQPHSFAVDWWSLGIMIYEFIMGIPPFHADSEKETHKNILRGTYEQPDADGFSFEIIDLISKLLTMNPEQRLGANGAQEVLDHPWFKDIDIENASPPFVPQLDSFDDTAYFEQRYNPQECDDTDILADIEEAISNRSRRSSSNIGSPSFTLSSSFVSSSPPSTNIDDDYSTEIGSFPSVSVTQLSNANKIALDHCNRRRSLSFVNNKDIDEEPVETPDSPMVSRSFVGLQSTSTTHLSIKRVRKRSQTSSSSSIHHSRQCSAVDDSQLPININMPK